MKCPSSHFDSIIMTKITVKLLYPGFPEVCESGKRHMFLFVRFGQSFPGWEDTGKANKERGRGGRACTTPSTACSSEKKKQSRWCTGKCQTRINGLITLLSILRVLSALKFPIFTGPPLTFFTALTGSVKGAGDLGNQSRRQKTLGWI